MNYKHQYNRGIFNKYHRAMPFSERILKDLTFLGNYLINSFKFGFSSQRMLVYPHYPSRKSTLFQLAKKLGLSITNRPDFKHEIAVYWEYLTFRKEFALLEELAQSKQVINLHSRNIGKLHVDEIFHEVFAYSTRINPVEFTGKMVKKNDINAKHDGIIIQGPVEPDTIEEGYIYQILIDNEVDENLVKDYRVPVIGTVADFLYVKYRDKKIQFSSHATVKAELHATSSVFSLEELEKLNRFCRRMNLEYGELDVLRNKADGRIYVVDVNNTPQGPNKKLSKSDRQLAIDKLAAAFQQAFM